ncbi:MAG: aminoglycoside phosphotransferase family protein, partial [Chloroflexi bacterium]|nr:aminoglycoside phosphotransferase family protein [Chloroflexota bacterium]
MIAIPPDFVLFTLAREGDAGRRWLKTLPDLVETLCKRWHLTVEGYAMHGGIALILPVHRENEPAILKISWIDESTKDEAAALLAWRGQGAVRLFEHEPSLGAMLLERLDSHSSLSTIEITQAITIAGQLLRRLAIPLPIPFRSLQATAAALAHTFPQRWERHGRPMSRRVLDRACSLAEQLGASPENNLLVNYDLHYA